MPRLLAIVLIAPVTFYMVLWLGFVAEVLWGDIRPSGPECDLVAFSDSQSYSGIEDVRWFNGMLRLPTRTCTAYSSDFVGYPNERFSQAYASTEDLVAVAVAVVATLLAMFAVVVWAVRRQAGPAGRGGMAPE